MQIAAQTHYIPVMQEVTSALQIQGQKLTTQREAIQTQTLIQVAIQTQVVIQFK